MALVNINLGNRRYLSPAEKDFLVKAIAISKTISEWIDQKADFLRLKGTKTIHPAIILADILIESKWGTHPLAQAHHKKKYSNNLALLKVDESWHGKSQEFEGAEYKSYPDWLSFATDYSDLVIFTKRDLLKSDNPISTLSAGKVDPLVYIVNSQSLIEYYRLKDI